MFNSILVVCIGNICRSPVAERMLQQLLPEKKISSAGVGALVGHPVDALAAEVAAKYGLDTSGHVARQLTPELCRGQDLILAMSEENREQVYRIAPEARGKVMLIGKWLDDAEIPDPYKQSRRVHEEAYQLLDLATQSWVNVIKIQF
ncbi:MAG: protein tyrosine phosphatase [Gammaproteobacteria bacterium SG8_11]|nr:MAG: protein tyrosine phosphatase [Gammaproteobacteria bacterium SG8_11]